MKRESLVSLSIKHPYTIQKLKVTVRWFSGVLFFDNIDLTINYDEKPGYVL